MTRRTTNDHARRVMRSLAAAVVLCCGCSGPILRPQSPEARIDLPPMPDVKYVSAYTHPYGMNYVKVEAVSLVTGLAGTGSDPPPTPQRAAAARRNESPRSGESRTKCSLRRTLRWCLVRAFLRPGIQEGDHFDVEVRTPTGSETTSLRNGWLLSTRLSEMAVLGQQVHEGHVLGMAEGPVLVDPTADPKKDPALATRGRILGGGVATKSRPLGLVISQQHQSVRVSQDIAARDQSSVLHVCGRPQARRRDAEDRRVHRCRAPPAVQRQHRPLHADVCGTWRSTNRPRRSRRGCMFLEQQLGDPLTSAERGDAAGSDRRRAGQGDSQARPCRRTIRKFASMRPKRWPTWTTRPPSACWPTWPATNRRSASTRWPR